MAIRVGFGGRGGVGIFWSGEPGGKLVAESIHAALGAGEAVNGQTALLFPAMDGAFIAAKECGYLFPGIESPAGYRWVTGRHCPEMSGSVR